MSAQSAKVRKALDAAVEAIGGSAREGQIEMAEAVANALSDRHHLIVQAGTGTGKSLAYLVPALVHGKKVLVATATLALQRQLVERDLPRVAPALSKVLGRDISFAIYKGIGNYLCLQKMNSGQADPDGEFLMELGALEGQSKSLREWIKDPKATGDRDDAPEVDRKVWLANSVSGRECVGADKCAFGQSCFAVKAKDAAQVADIVVTNHTLLAIEIVESHPILPNRDAVVLDEAHEFLDRTTQAITEELSSTRALRAAGMARKYKPGAATDAFGAAASDLDAAMEYFATEYRSDPTKQGRLDTLPISLSAPIKYLRETAQIVINEIGAEGETGSPDEIATRARAKGAVNEVNQTLSKLLKLTPDSVLWFEPTYKTLQLAPLTVATLLRDNLLKKTPVIATSATLTFGKSFDSIAKSIGFTIGDESDIELKDNEIDPGNLQMLDVGSPFDFANQGMLYLPRGLPEPSREAVSIDAFVELGELIKAAGGRTLALFSSWRALESAQEYLHKALHDLPIKIISQRRGDAVGPLVEKFAADETSILLGTISLWQGVDVPGRSCILVAIDRIPFPRPDEPVMAARAAQVDSTGGSGFMQVSLPRAALLLAQGTGRLIRGVDDRGVVAILDSRITTKRYGSILLNTMPPLWRTSDGEVVRESLRRLAQDLTEV